MNENIDLVKILDGCPEGVRFYSPLFGVVEFICILYNGASEAIGIKIRCFPKTGRTYDALLERNGLYFGWYNGEIMLFPAKKQRDWSMFKRFWDKPKVERFDTKTFQPFDRVLVMPETDKPWECDIFSHYEMSIYPYICIGGIWKQCVPYNDETKHLVGTTDDCPEYYKWREE